MANIEVRAGWQADNQAIGTLHIENVNGKEIQSFSFSNAWLSKNAHLALDPDLMLTEGRQYLQGKPTFGMFADASPDRWGRVLIDRAEDRNAEAEGRHRKTLMESDYLLRVSDALRIGGLRFFDTETGAYASESEAAPPPITDLRTLEAAAWEFDPKDRTLDLKDLFVPGSSLGGARPKANVADTDGSLWIAKFPSKQDALDVEAWEKTAIDLEKMCGIRVPEAKTMKTSERGTILLTKRFDRKEKTRMHFASAMTMLSETDHSADEKNVGYVDLAEMLEQLSCNAKEDLRELWRRMIFNICICNTDDHLRNHGLLLSPKGWYLSPAYDVNPNPDKEYMSLTVQERYVRDLRAAEEIAELFHYKNAEVKEDLEMIQTVIQDNFEKIAKNNGIAADEIRYMAQILL